MHAWPPTYSVFTCMHAHLQLSCNDTETATPDCNLKLVRTDSASLDNPANLRVEPVLAYGLETDTFTERTE